MRRLIALTLVVAACSGDRQASKGATTATYGRGTDQIAVRIPRAGGTARAYLYPALDSVIWSAPAAPAVDRVLGFDSDAGSIALVDEKGQPRRIDLRMGEVRTASRAKLAGLVSQSGNEIYGITPAGVVSRLTPSGDWTFEPPSPAQALFPQPDGSLIIAGTRAGKTPLWLIRPTDDKIIDSVSLERVMQSKETQAGDLLYFTSDRAIVGVRARDLSRVEPVKLREDAEDIASTPSGDRIYVALQKTPRLLVFNRYSGAVEASVDLPGPASEIRVDPLGQQLLVKPRQGDSAWVIATGTDSLTGTIRTEWRPDLPAFAFGTIATAASQDVVFLDADKLSVLRTVPGGARDFWYFFAWNGFRPRAADVDQPVVFTSPEPSRADSPTMIADTARVNPPIRDTAPTMLPPPALPPSVAPSRGAFLVSFAAVLTEDRARETAASIQVGGAHPRIMQSVSGGTTIYRVVLGPYPTREEADRVGRDSKRPYLVFEAPQ
ncbi:MAG TPA: SPOR domain-containing protein [Gemmatimonadaceae bacterium]